MSVELPLSHDELNVIRNRVRCSAESQYTVWWELLVREAQRAAVNAALERAAQVCSHLDDWTGGHGMPASPGSSVYVAAIRALKSEEA